MGEFTGKQKLYLCCGYFCALMGCIGVYFWLVLFFMEATHSPYLIYEMQKMDSMEGQNLDDINVFKWSFLITSFVRSFLISCLFQLNLVCCVACGWCATTIRAPEDALENDLDFDLPPLVERKGISMSNSNSQVEPVMTYALND